MSEMRSADGGAGDVDHGKISYTYGRFGKPDPQIAAQIDRTLDDARIILNVGAGAGIYKSLDRDVKAVDPSGSMRSQRLHHLAVTIDAVAEDFPFADDSFDVSRFIRRIQMLG